MQLLDVSTRKGKAKVDEERFPKVFETHCEDGKGDYCFLALPSQGVFHRHLYNVSILAYCPHSFFILIYFLNRLMLCSR